MARNSSMGQDSSRWSHGWFYHIFFDRPLEEARRVVIDVVPECARVLDIACGTGELCRGLRAAKGCRVVGVELSHRMLRFATAHTRLEGITYVHGDATNLSSVESGEYDYATLLFLMHEIPMKQRVRALEEALRVAQHVVAVDSHVPLPRNAHAAALHLVEAMGGREHYASFADYLATGGMMGVVSRLEPPVSVVHAITFWHGCRDALVLSLPGRVSAGDVAVGQGPPN
jgi:SAM-dependent methyltransferase